MGILDEAIREHLELKRQHGAADPELKQLEDEAFGPPERPSAEGPAGDALAEAPTEFMAAPGTAEEEKAPEAAEEAPQRRESAAIGDLQEAPAPSEPAEEEQPAAEHEAVESADHPEREAIAEQPTEHFDVEEDLAVSEKRGPSEEELVEEEMVEPRLAPVDPLAAAELEEGGEVEVVETEPEPEADEEDDEFWNEQRLSDELDQALEAPVAKAGSETAEHEPLDEAEEAEEEATPESDPDSDVLENTPDFLEDAPEDDELWFEQKPPKDFDFDD
jgi:hypothetical protein